MPNEKLNVDEIRELIPHREPFLFLDELINIKKLSKATGIKTYSNNENFFKGHFPGRPTLPGVLMCESIAQLGAYVVLQDNRFKDKLPLFGGLENARFRQQVIPGDTIKLRVEVLRLSARGGKAFGEAFVNGNLACSAELMFIAVEK